MLRITNGPTRSRMLFVDVRIASSCFSLTQLSTLAFFSPSQLPITSPTVGCLGAGTPELAPASSGEDVVGVDARGIASKE